MRASDGSIPDLDFAPMKNRPSRSSFTGRRPDTSCSVMVLAGLGVLTCGSSAWAQRGHETLAVDFSQTAFAALNSLTEKQRKLTVLNIDLFELTPKSTQPFDIIFEYGCFNSVHPGRRDEYFEVWDRMLQPNGIVIAAFYPLIRTTSLDGPPHPTSEGELMARLDGVFDVQEKIIPKKSSKERVGKEEIWILTKPK